jgi:hypothetical protein
MDLRCSGIIYLLGNNIFTQNESGSGVVQKNAATLRFKTVVKLLLSRIFKFEILSVVLYRCESVLFALTDGSSS